MQVEKNIPIPYGVAKEGSLMMPFLDEMEVGDSFTIPKHHVTEARAILSRINRYMRMHFVTQREGDRIRVWRTN